MSRSPSRRCIQAAHLRSSPSSGTSPRCGSPRRGTRGAPAVFGPQKGAGPEDIAALDKGLEHAKDVGEEAVKTATTLAEVASGTKLLAAADRFAIGATLVASAIDLGMTINDYVEKEKQRAEYDTIVAEADEPVSVKGLLDSGNDDDKRSLLLYWALATSPHSANAKLGEGNVSNAALCQTDEWTRLQCSQAKNAILAAATIAAATMATGN